MFDGPTGRWEWSSPASNTTTTTTYNNNNNNSNNNNFNTGSESDTDIVYMNPNNRKIVNYFLLEDSDAEAQQDSFLPSPRSSYAPSLDDDFYTNNNNNNIALLPIPPP